MEKYVYYRNTEGLKDEERIFTADLEISLLEDVYNNEHWDDKDELEFGKLKVALHSACFDETITYIGEY